MTTEPLPADAKTLLNRIINVETLLREKDSVLNAIRRSNGDAVACEHRRHDVEDQYRLPIEQFYEAVVILGENGTVLCGNLGFAAMLDIAGEPVIGQRLQRFLPPEDAMTFTRMLDGAKRAITRNELILCSAAGKKTTDLSFTRSAAAQYRPDAAVWNTDRSE